MARIIRRRKVTAISAFDTAEKIDRQPTGPNGLDDPDWMRKTAGFWKKIALKRAKGKEQKEMEMKNNKGRSTHS